jgi:type I restriction enzyme M protein
MVSNLSFVNYEDTQKLYNHLYQACNILRGPIYPEEYKTYIFPLLFYKRLCDEYTREINIALEESKGDMYYALFPENHRFVIPEGNHWNDIRNKTKNIGYALQTAFRNIERANHQSLITIFNDFDDAKWSNKERLTDERLKNLIEHFSSLNLDNAHCPNDILGQAYEWLIKKFADLTNKKAGEFYTPRTVVQLLVRIIDPQPGETIYDPACGTGGMLIEARRHISHKNDDTACLRRIYGQEKNLSTSAIARMNLYLHGANDFFINRGDTLKNPAFIQGDKLKTFDCVISNPPFSLENWGSEVWESDKYGRNFLGIPPPSSGDFAWIEHMIKSMNSSKGRIAVVLPQGILFRPGQEGKMRESLLKMDLIDTIIGLAPNLFYGTGLSAYILIFKAKKSSERKGKIMFIDASSIYKKGRAHNEILIEHVEYIYELATKNDNIKGLCRLVSFKEIETNKCNLNVSRYVETVFEENSLTLNEALRNLKQSFDDTYVAENHLKELLRREKLLNG